MAFACRPVLGFVLLLRTVVMELEDMRPMTWGFLQSCSFQRMGNPKICCCDMDCPSSSCCELYFALGGFSVRGKCVPRDPNTLVCSRRRTCKYNRECGTGECCRSSWQSANQGVCDRRGQHGDVCIKKPLYVYQRPLLCSCDVGNTCEVAAHNIKGFCRDPSLVPPSTTSSSTTTTTLLTTTTTTPFTTTVTKPQTTTTTEVTTTVGPCDRCLNSEFYCCVNNQCRIKPRIGESCEPDGCPCRDSSTCVGGICRAL